MRQIPAMTLHRPVLALALCALLAGCLTMTPEQRAEQQAKRNEERCVARGYKPGTDEFSDCVVRVDGERDQRMERNRRHMMEQRPTVPGNRGY
jgi:hypothetical protein